MIDKILSLDYVIIEELFKNGTCMSYDPTHPMPAWQYSKQLEQDYKKAHNVKRCRIVSATAKLWQQHYHPRFHYFSDGSLIFARYIEEKGAREELENIKKMLEIRGYPLRKIYAPLTQIEFFKYDEYLRYISNQALQRYSYLTDLSVEAFPSKEEFVAECFAGNNVLLTACQNENINPSCREYLALFADGRFYVSENYGFRVETANFSKITSYERVHPEYLRLEYVPQEYIDALYEKAKAYAWYVSPEKAAENQKLSFNDLMKMRKYIDDLFQNRKCVSVLNPDNCNEMITPDLDKYALFSDGLLVIAQSRSRFDEDSFFIKQMHQCYPNYAFTVEQVPDYYLPEIYRKLPECQKGAAVIYIEMLKQKARKLKRMLEISHCEALDIVAQMSGWPSWKAIKIEDESHARHLVYHEVSRKRAVAKNNPENPLMWEYERWQMRMKHQK